MTDTCSYVRDGLDTDGTEWFRCVTHDETAPSHDAPCAASTEPAYSSGLVDSNPAPFVLWGVPPDHYSPHVARVPIALMGGTLEAIREDIPFRRAHGWRQLVAVPEGSHPYGVATCGTCGRSWDVLRHPTPATLCPFDNGDETAAAPFECYPFPTDDERQAAMTDTDLAADYAAAVLDTMRAAVVALDEGGQLEGVDAETYLDEWPLEVVRQVGRRFEVVVTVGGPDARLTCDLDEDGDRWGPAALEVSWGLSTARREGSDVDRLADYYIERTAP